MLTCSQDSRACNTGEECLVEQSSIRYVGHQAGREWEMGDLM